MVVLKATANLIAKGVVERDFINRRHGSPRAYWLAITDYDGGVHINLRKEIGPSDIKIGSMVDIYEVNKSRGCYRYGDRWDKSEKQYPEGPLNEAQRQEFEKLRPQFSKGPYLGTVVLYVPSFNQEIVVLDEKPTVFVGWSDKVVSLYKEQYGEFPIDARIMFGHRTTVEGVHLPLAYQL